jgi:cell division ATPase FtsA
MELAERVFDLPVKRSQPHIIEGLSGDFIHPSFSSVLGLVEWSYAQKKTGRLKRKNTVMEPVFKAGKQIRSWIEDLV